MRVLYLSGAPRLSTKASTESLGPRSHILGVINGLKSHGSKVDQFIVGDLVPSSIHSEGSEKRMSSSRWTILIADAGRIAFRWRSRMRLHSKTATSKYDLMYERYALYQELGSAVRAQVKGFWVLEVNALLAIESTSERRVTSSKRFALIMERKTLERADAIVAVTKALADQIIQVHGITPSKIIVVQNGVDHEPHQHRAELTMFAPKEVDDKKTIIGFLGTLYAWQKVDLLLESIKRPEFASVSVRIAGGGPELAKLQSLVTELGLVDRVVFEGRIHPDDVALFLSEVDVCYAGHESENGVYFSPLKLWEYLAAGRIILASKHQTTSQLQDEGYSVVCFDRGESSLQNALRRVISSKNALQLQAANMQQRVWREHSWSQRVKPVMDLVIQNG
ncbi:glycosyltransferase [Arthrobacter sp. RIT-PI-e]|uniref:glycosyltransferase n=1 Tax=Arthrobacter sp. RIT-PI-e TaxID=1681197 RepID=UPI0009E36B9D|nr:glycosyltransferase [Arthrobacter sp. RIT-PI-e]